MTFARASAFVAVFVGAVVLGVWLAPHVTDGAPNAAGREVVADAAVVSETAPVARVATVPAARPALPLVALSEPALHERVKPILTRGTNIDSASKGFEDAEQFVSVAYAAKNTQIPFALLKHRVLMQGKSLSAAIRESKPQINASVEADRARAEARSEIARIGS